MNRVIETYNPIAEYRSKVEPASIFSLAGDYFNSHAKKQREHAETFATDDLTVERYFLSKGSLTKSWMTVSKNSDKNVYCSKIGTSNYYEQGNDIITSREAELKNIDFSSLPYEMVDVPHWCVEKWRGYGIRGTIYIFKSHKNHEVITDALPPGCSKNDFIEHCEVKLAGRILAE